VLASHGEAGAQNSERDLWSEFLPERTLSQTNVRAGVSQRIGGGAVRFEAGVRQEEDGILGAVIGGAFGSHYGSATYYQAGAFDVAVADGWRARGRAAIGRTTTGADGADGFFAGVDNLTSTQFALGAYKRGFIARGDRLSFSVSQPLSVETGNLRLIVPESYDGETETFAFAERRIGLGGRREIDIEAGYAFGLPSGGVIEANVLRQMNVTADGGDSTAAIIRTRFDF
jgi:hypothetical protein